MSVFHRIRDTGSMRSVTFLKLAARLAAYNGAVAARISAERRERAPKPGHGRGTRTVVKPLYDERSPMANNARTADTAPPATGTDFARLNVELGQNWFSYKKVGPDGALVTGGGEA
jgi:hypothetical protein